MFAVNRSVSLACTALVVLVLLAGPSPAQQPADPTKAIPARARPVLVETDASLDADWHVVAGDLLGNHTTEGHRVWFTLAQDPHDQLFGATFQPVAEALRAHLGLPADRGLLLASVRGEGPCAQVGMKANDILLTVAGQPVFKADDLSAHLKAAGGKPAALVVLRAGRPVTLAAQPVTLVTLGPAAPEKTEYFIGVSLNALDDAFRAQLNLPASKGVLVTEVVTDSPAAKAGMKAHDILLEVAGKVVESPEALAKMVQANKDKPASVTLLRGGKPQTVTVTGAVRKVETSVEGKYLLTYSLAERDRPASLYRARLFHSAATSIQAQSPTPANAPAPDVGRRLQELEKSLDAVRKSLQELQATLKASPAPKKD